MEDIPDIEESTPDIEPPNLDIEPPNLDIEPPNLDIEPPNLDIKIPTPAPIDEISIPDLINDNPVQLPDGIIDGHIQEIMDINPHSPTFGEVHNEIEPLWSERPMWSPIDPMSIRDLTGENAIELPGYALQKVGGDIHNTLDINPHSPTFGNLHWTIQIADEWKEHGP